MTDYIIRYAEIALKGKNRHHFERQLIRNIKTCAEHFNCHIQHIAHNYGRIIITGDNLDVIRIVFGIASISPATTCARDLDAITRAAIEYARTLPSNSTLRINTKRMDKTFAHKSPDVNRHVALAIESATTIQPELRGGEHEIGIEIGPHAAYVHGKKIECFGGLPVGTGGTAHATVRTDADILATLLTLKRGVRVHLTNDGISPDAHAMLIAFGAAISHTLTPYTVSAQSLKSLNAYSPSTLYSLIAMSDENIHHELTHYRNVYDNIRHEN